MENQPHIDGEHNSSSGIISRLKKLSLRAALTILLVGGIALSLLFFAALTISTFHQEKLSDYLAVMYLELEQQASVISRRIQQEPSTKNSFWNFTGENKELENNKLIPPTLSFGIYNDLSLREAYQRVDNISLETINLKHASFSPQYNIISYGGNSYLSTFTTARQYKTITGKTFPSNVKKVLLLWKIDIIKYFQVAERNEATTVYAISREGKLLYSNSDKVTPNALFDRQLVRKFINSGVNHGQVKFEIEGVSHHGFYYEIPNTNIILFNETSTAAITKPVTSKVFRYVLYSFGVSLIIILCFYLLTSYTTRPLKNLVKISDRISGGDYSISPQISGSGEVADLAIAFRKMITALKVRDLKLRKAFEEHKEKVRLEEELKVAQHIQKNLLPVKEGLKNETIDIHARYLPADECAGDWYYFMDFEDFSVFCIADVSGHGVGSAMYTAIIASIFNEQIHGTSDIDPTMFANKVNKAIYDLGGGLWHATLLFGVLDKKRESLELLNMGHPACFLSLFNDDSEVNLTSISMPSTPAGISEEVDYATSTLSFPKGSSLFAYSDGLIEAKNTHNRSYGSKKLKKCLLDLSDASSENVILETLEKWSRFREGVKPIDDICILNIRLLS